jgi:hypothetical protein
LGALPGVPPSILFPLLGAMRAPLGPVLAGTLVGRTPVLALTTALFAWVGGIGGNTDSEAVTFLGVTAVLLLVFRLVGLIDWPHRAATGEWRLRNPDAGAMRFMGAAGMGQPGAGAPGAGNPWASTDVGADDDIVEGEFLGEEIDGEDAPDTQRKELPGSGDASSGDDPRS